MRSRQDTDIPRIANCGVSRSWNGTVPLCRVRSATSAATSPVVEWRVAAKRPRLTTNRRTESEEGWNGRLDGQRATACVRYEGLKSKQPPYKHCDA